MRPSLPSPNQLSILIELSTASRPKPSNHEPPTPSIEPGSIPNQPKPATADYHHVIANQTCPLHHQRPPRASAQRAPNRALEILNQRLIESKYECITLARILGKIGRQKDIDFETTQFEFHASAGPAGEPTAMPARGTGSKTLRHINQIPLWVADVKVQGHPKASSPHSPPDRPHVNVATKESCSTASHVP